MKFLIVFVLALAIASAFVIEPRDIVTPVVEEENRITNGKPASSGQFPYQVGILLTLNNSESAWCGGSLIGHKWVLTAAHCFEKVKKVTVYLGSTRRSSPKITHTVSKNKIIIHPGWDKYKTKNDIALIKIPYVKYSSEVKAVKLPAMGKKYSSYRNKYVIATGWGRISDYIENLPDKLQWARLKVISNTECSYSFGDLITSSNICVATPKGTSPCNGDSGGPLVLESTKVQVGITSFGSLVGCEIGYPAVFTRVTTYLDWIKKTTGIKY